LLASSIYVEHAFTKNNEIIKIIFFIFITTH